MSKYIKWGLILLMAFAYLILTAVFSLRIWALCNATNQTLSRHSFSAIALTLCFFTSCIGCFISIAIRLWKEIKRNKTKSPRSNKI
jgi:uncharacterized membrane protein YbhN (UPF0104 family)